MNILEAFQKYAQLQAVGQLVKQAVSAEMLGRAVSGYGVRHGVDKTLNRVAKGALDTGKQFFGQVRPTNNLLAPIPEMGEAASKSLTTRNAVYTDAYKKYKAMTGGVDEAKRKAIFDSLRRPPE